MRDKSEPLLAIEKACDDDSPEGSSAARGSALAPDEPAEQSGDPLADAAEEFVTARSDTRELRPEPSAVAGNGEAQPEPESELETAPKAIASERAKPAAARGKRRVPPAAFDPITRILALMERERRVGMSIGLAGALVVHGAAAAHGYAALIDLSAFAGAIRSAVADDVRATYAVEVNKPPPPPPPPEPEPEKPQIQPKAPAAPQNAQQEKPPAPAQAAKLLTASPDPAEPLDLTDQGFVSGEGDRFAGGVTSATGTAKTAVRDLNAKPGGVVGGKGTGPVLPPAAPKEDHSRPAAPASRDWGDCGFPAEADVEQIDFMRLSIVVTVGTDGRAQSVTVLKDPGYGFGNQARQCALRKSYNVGLNAEGKPYVTTTPPFIVTFRR